MSDAPIPPPAPPPPTDPPAASTSPAGPPAAPGKERHWGRIIVVSVIVIAVAVVTFLVLAAFIPRWWAHRIGDQVNQSTASGIGLGLFYGSVFTFVPLMVLWFGFRKRRRVRVWALCLIGALVVALPNLLTLGIVLGTGDAAHDGERILSTEANYFRASSLYGAIGGTLVFLAFQYGLFARWRHKRTERQLRDELRARDAVAQADRPPADGSPEAPPE